MTSAEKTGFPGVGLCIVGITMALVCVLVPHPTRALTGSDFFPFEIGNFWTYDDAGTSITQTVTGVNNVGGTDIFELTQSGGAASGLTQGFSGDSNGVQYYGGQGPSPEGTLIVDLTPPLLQLPPTFNIGDQFGGSGSAFLQIIGVGSATVPYTSSASVVGVDPVTVPFGTFPNAILIDSTLNLGGEVTSSQDWIVRGFGPVKSVILGPEGSTWELTGTNVPEPSTAFLVGLGLVGIAVQRRRANTA